MRAPALILTGLLAVTGCSSGTASEEDEQPLNAVGSHPSGEPLVSSSNADPYVDSAGATRTRQVSAEIIRKGYKKEEGAHGPEERAYCAVKITNRSPIKVTVAVDVYFNSGDGTERLDTYPVGSNDMRPGQSYTATPTTTTVLKPTSFTCDLGEASGYVPVD